MNNSNFSQCQTNIILAKQALGWELNSILNEGLRHTIAYSIYLSKSRAI